MKKSEILRAGYIAGLKKVRAVLQENIEDWTAHAVFHEETARQMGLAARRKEYTRQYDIQLFVDTFNEQVAASQSCPEYGPGVTVSSMSAGFLIEQMSYDEYSDVLTVETDEKTLTVEHFAEAFDRGWSGNLENLGFENCMVNGEHCDFIYFELR